MRIQNITDMIRFTGDLRCDFEKAAAEIIKLKDRILGYQGQIACLRSSVKTLKKTSESARNRFKETLAEKDAVIRELTNRPAHAQALPGHDGSSTGTPTSQTPINKNKVIPNSRRSSGKPEGGQNGREKSAPGAPDEPEVTDIIGHPLQDDECCPKCGVVDCTPTIDPGSNMNTTSVSRSLRSNMSFTTMNATTVVRYSVPGFPRT